MKTLLRLILVANLNLSDPFQTYPTKKLDLATLLFKVGEKHCFEREDLRILIK